MNEKKLKLFLNKKKPVAISSRSKWWNFLGGNLVDVTEVKSFCPFHSKHSNVEEPLAPMPRQMTFVENRLLTARCENTIWSSLKKCM